MNVNENAASPPPELLLLEWQLQCGAHDIVSDAAEDRTVKKTPPAPPPQAVPQHVQAQTPQTQSSYSSFMPPKTPPAFDVAALTARTREEADNADTIDELRASVEAFKEMPVCKTAINTVFSDGVPGSRVMLIGEAPGQQEDEQGIPFCGASGQLLEQILNAIGLKRAENYYISNTLFWRPPGNRKPTDDEMHVCQPYVEKHIALAKPEVLLLVGGTAIQMLLNTKAGVTKLRGKFHGYTNRYLDGAEIPAMPVFHPSYLLRSPGQKKFMWEDMLAVESKLIKN